MKIIKYKWWNRIYMFPIALCFLAVVLAGCGKTEVHVPEYNDEVEPADEVEMFAMVCNIDEVNGKVMLRSVGYTSELTLSFTGGADVQDKYGELLPISGVPLGSIVDVVYDANRSKLLSMYITRRESVENKEGVSGAEIDYVENTVKLNGKTYQMSKNVAAFSGNKEIKLNEICSEDQLSIWLDNNIVCSFNVELGHGYVKLVDYASYIGGMVEIGYDVIVPVTEDMLLTVREGTYTLRIAKGNDSGTKEVTVERNKEITLSLADIAIEPKQMGSILFHVTPSDAAVYIDKVRVNTEGAVELVYGKHRLDIVKEGYDTISGTITVKAPYKVKDYTMTETGATTESAEKKSTTATTRNTTTSPVTTEKTTEAATTATESGETGTETATEAASETDNSGNTEASTEASSDVRDVQADTGEKTANKVIVAAPIGASIYFDGEYIGVTPISFTKVTGSHIITLSQTGYLSKSYTVTFTDDGKDETVTYDALVSISSLIE